MALAKCLCGLEDYVTANYHRYDDDHTWSLCLSSANVGRVTCKEQGCCEELREYCNVLSTTLDTAHQ